MTKIPGIEEGAEAWWLGSESATEPDAAVMSIAISMKRIADAIVADIERHNDDVPGPVTRIADALTGADAGRAIGERIGQEIYHGISTALFEAWQRGAPT